MYGTGVSDRDQCMLRLYPYVQPRSRKMSNKIGIGIPRSHRRMYPAAPACLIRLVNRISNFPNVVDSEFFLTRLNLLCLLKHTIGIANDCLIRKNPIVHKPVLSSKFRDCAGLGTISKRLRLGIGYILLLFGVLTRRWFFLRGCS